MFPFDMLAGWVLDLLTDAVRSKLESKAQRKAFGRAVERALFAFDARHPSWHAALFDEQFLQHGAAPMLADFVNRRGALPEPAQIAAAWAAQFPGIVGAGVLSAAEAAVSDLLGEVQRQLAVENALQPFLDRLAWDTASRNSERIVKEIAALAAAATRDRIAACIDALSRAAYAYEAAAGAHNDSAAVQFGEYRLQARTAFQSGRRALILMKYPGVDRLIAIFREQIIDGYENAVAATDQMGDASAELAELEERVAAFQQILDEEIGAA